MLSTDLPSACEVAALHASIVAVIAASAAKLATATAWEAVAKLATKFAGEVVLPQPSEATWVLTEVSSKECLGENYLERQFRINDNQEPQDFASRWLGEQAKRNIDWMVSTAAWDKCVDESALRPCWQKMTVRAVAPVCEPEKLGRLMEWRLYGKVTTIGQLLLQLGGTVDLFVAC